MVEKEGMINFYQCTWCHSQHDSSLYRQCCENLKTLYLVPPDVATNKCLKLRSVGKCFHVVRYTISSKTLVHYLTNNTVLQML